MFQLISRLKAVPVGRPVSFKISYVHEEQHLAKGASIRIGYNFNDGAGKCQTENPQEANYLTVKTTANVKLEVVSAGRRRSITFYPGTGMCDLLIFEINIISGTLNPGDTIDIFLGTQDCSKGGFIIGKCCDSPFELFYHIDPGGCYPLQGHHPNAPYLEYMTADGSKYPQWKSCGIKVPLIAGEPVWADISLPSTIVPCEDIQVRVAVYDSFFNHLRHYQNEIELLSSDNVAVRFRSRSFSTGSTGYALLPIIFERPLPPTNLRFHIPGLGIFHTNPVQVSNVRSDKIFWGDMHGHSCLSDGGCRNADDFFSYARNIRGLDFAALTDHTFGLAVKGHWSKLLKAVEKHSVDRKFLAILGYEIMTNGFGHRNVYFPGVEGNLLMADYQPGCGGSFRGEKIQAYQQILDSEVLKTPTIEETIAALNGKDLLWTAHHCGKIVQEECPLLLLYEVCSEWGLSDDVLRMNLSTMKLKEVFAQGLSPGLTGGSDDHRAKAGFLGKAITDGPVRYPSGLTAVICPSLERASLYNALKKKLCYTTTGGRILLNIHVNRMGKQLRVNLDITGTNLLDRGWVFKNGNEVYHTYFDTGNAGKLHWEDKMFIEKDTCYIRLSQMNGEMAWLNPVPFANS